MRKRLYVPLDVDYASDEKILEVGNNGELLYVRSLAFAKRILSDGRISDAQAAHLGRGIRALKSTTDALVRTNLWEKMPSGGYRITAWSKHNDSRVIVEARQEIASESGLRGNHLRHHVEGGNPSSRCRLCVEEHLAKPSGTRPDAQPGSPSGSAPTPDEDLLAKTREVETETTTSLDDSNGFEKPSTNGASSSNPNGSVDEITAVLELAVDGLRIADRPDTPIPWRRVVLRNMRQERESWIRDELETGRSHLSLAGELCGGETYVRLAHPGRFP